MSADVFVPRVAMRAFWLKLGIDLLDPNLKEVQAEKILVSAEKYDAAYKELEKEYPAIIKRSNRMEWGLAWLQYAPRRVEGQEEDVIIEEGGVTYARTTVGDS